MAVRTFFSENGSECGKMHDMRSEMFPCCGGGVLRCILVRGRTLLVGIRVVRKFIGAIFR